MRCELPTRARSRAWLAACLLATLPAFGAEEGIAWLDDYGATLARAQKEDRLVMIEFYTAWCLYCGKMEKETFGDPRVRGLAQDFVCARVDADVQKSAASRYEPPGYPTVVFATPTGEELLKVSGFRGPDPFYLVMKTVRERGGAMAGYLSRLEREPKDFEALKALGQIYLDLGLADKATEYLSAASKLASGSAAGPEADAEVQFLLGRAATLGEEYGRATKLLEKLIASRPGDANAPKYYLELARAYDGAGKDKKAREVVAKLGQLFPDAPEAESAKALVPKE